MESSDVNFAKRNFESYATINASISHVMKSQEPPNHRNGHALPLTGLQTAGIGALCGMTEVILQQPTISIKNAIQQKKPMSFHPLVLYRGLGINCASIAPITGIQFGVHGFFTSMYQQYQEDNGKVVKMNMGTQLAIAGSSGIAAAVIGGPAELLMTVQQRSGLSLGQTLQQLVQHLGLSSLSRGLAVTAFRDMVWCSSYLALGPLISLRLVDFAVLDSGTSDASSLRWGAQLGGSILAGLATVILTQPADTLKTVMQGQLASVLKNPRQSHVTSGRRVVRELYAAGGMRRFYTGTVARGLRLIGGVFILNQSRTVFEDAFFQSRWFEN